MKFDSNLDYFENAQARQDYRHNDLQPHTAYAELNPEERNWLMALNAQLKQIEKQYLPIMKAKENAIRARIADPDDWMQDFNLELVITFYLRKDDHEYEEWDDNILMQIMECCFDADEPDWEWGFGATETNYAESPEGFEGEHHCWLYHQLYDHVSLDWRDLLRIGEIGVEAKIDEQSGILLADSATSEKANGLQNPVLSDIHNISTGHRFRYRHVEKQTAYSELSADERSRLMALNAQLKRLEGQYLLILNANGEALQARVNDPADWMRYFRLEFVLTFYLREDDPEYEEDDDNILMRLRESGFDYDEPNRETGFGITSINYCPSKECHEGEHHGYLYHALADHCNLDWRDLLRIGELWVDVIINEQSGRLPVGGSLAVRLDGL
jgi:hypothetical protein